MGAPSRALPRWTAAMVAALTACKPPVPPQHATPETARVPAVAAVPPIAVRSELHLAGGSVCVLDPQRGDFVPYCFSPFGDPEFAKGSAPGPRKIVARSGPKGARAVSTECFLTGDTARCEGRADVTGVRSIEGDPYLLKVDGTVEVLRDDDRGCPGCEDDASANQSKREARRREAASKLPRIQKVVEHGGAACALAEDGRVLCWIEPWAFNFYSNAFNPIVVREIPKLRATDVLLQPFLNVCARTRDGDVACSPPHAVPLEVCAPRGKATFCGPSGASGSNTELRGPGFAVHDSLAPALVPVPGVRAGTLAPLVAFKHRPYEESVAGTGTNGRAVVGETDPGGCIADADTVRCWYRDACTAGRPWVATRVDGVPNVAVLATGSRVGYVVTRTGELFAFPHHLQDENGPGADGPCGVKLRPAPATKVEVVVSAVRVALSERVRSVAGGLLSSALLPGYASADCAVSESGDVWCWTSDVDPSGLMLGPPQAFAQARP